MKPSPVRILAATGGRTLAFIAYNLITSPNEAIAHNNTGAIAWMLISCQRDISLPITITEKNIANSSYWSGFGDSEVTIQIKCDPLITREYRNRCTDALSKVEIREKAPDPFRNVNYDTCYSHSTPPSINYHILFSESDTSSILIRRTKS